MKKLLSLALLAVSGCGLTLTVTEQEPAASQPAPQPLVFSGTYVGEETCISTQWFGAQVIDVVTQVGLNSVSFSGRGIPLLDLDGSEQFVGQATVTDSVRNETSCTTTRLTQNENSVVIVASCIARFDGRNNCQFANDGRCDEVAFCDLGTDFSDCGPVIYDMDETKTYILVDESSILYTYSNRLVETFQGQSRFTKDCTASLSR